MILSTDIILLLNSFAMFLLSFCTDYWMHREYKLDQLLPELEKMNYTLIENWNGQFAWQHIIYIHYSDKPQVVCKGNSQFDHRCLLNDRKTIYLFSEYGNLYRECNDLLDGSREILNDVGQLYKRPCNYYITGNEKWHMFRENANVTATEVLNFIMGFISVILILLATCTGLYGTMHHHMNAVITTGIALTILCVIYVGALILFLFKIHLIQRHFGRKDYQSPQEQLANSYRVIRLGWSFVAAIISLIMCSSAAYLYLASGRKMRQRRRNILRRRQMQTALMSSCREEVALAIRAKMTVI